MAKKATKKTKKTKKNRVRTNQKLYKSGIITESYIIHKSVIFLFIISLLVNFFSISYIKRIGFTRKEKIVTKIKEVVPENILFLGDSITDFYDLNKYYPNYRVVNSGISGNITDDILNNMEERVYRYNPSLIFILIGTNDLDRNVEVDIVVEHIKQIITEIQENRKEAKIYLESIYPINQNIKNSKANRRENKKIEEVNEKIKEYCSQENINYIDLYNDLKDENGNLNTKYTDDGLHVNDRGYEVITNKITNIIKKSKNK